MFAVVGGLHVDAGHLQLQLVDDHTVLGAWDVPIGPTLQLLAQRSAAWREVAHQLHGESATLAMRMPGRLTGYCLAWHEMPRVANG